MDRNELIDKLKPYFEVSELVCPHCYSKFGESSWQFISTELLSTLYILRTKIFNKPITILIERITLQYVLVGKE